MTAIRKSFDGRGLVYVDRKYVATPSPQRTCTFHLLPVSRRTVPIHHGVPAMSDGY
ncbi:hypothetical protein [Bradyrhizobium vignae]|uniref:Uncharacterized protein n=1 Tax=Bradyrhizobium vignae TaxID=1549949 RepID=A0A2U3PRN6_9BRAD|nr:hypothetical protein [Bradyrhizobium vignae]SPP91831.1 protein of unknown function [Bradyrhizobium vignae]